MYKIDAITKQINLTRGDTAIIRVGAKNDDETDYEFQIGDVVRFKVYERKECSCIVLKKDVIVEIEGTTVDINLTSEDTKIGELINQHKDYWYEVELNPDTNPKTIIGYEVRENGSVWEKIFRLLPEGDDN